MIWFAMLIPVLTVFILWYYFDQKTTWWEFLVPLVCSFILCLCAKLASESVSMNDTEWWSGAVQVAEYYEDWDERVACRHPVYRTETRTGTRTGSNGKTETYTYTVEVFDHWQHPYDVDYHPPYWTCWDNNQIAVSIESEWFEHIASKFESRQFVNLHRHYHSKDGNKYVATWPGTDETCEVMTTTHSYTNRIIASHSVFRFPEVEDKSALFDNPKHMPIFNAPYIFGEITSGDHGITNLTAQQVVSVWNAKHAKDKQIRLIFCIFNEQPFQTAIDQEAFWQGGNKNEFIVMIGLDATKKIDWCHVASWTDNELLKADVKDHVRESGPALNIPKIMEWLGPELEEKFERKHFKDFDYISVEPPMWASILTYILVLMLNVLLGFWIVNNGIDDDEPPI